ncbi:hypothetical protein Efla_001299 [Eimeria flavescens]
MIFNFEEVPLGDRLVCGWLADSGPVHNDHCWEINSGADKLLHIFSPHFTFLGYLIRFLYPIFERYLKGEQFILLCSSACEARVAAQQFLRRTERSFGFAFAIYFFSFVIPATMAYTVVTPSAQVLTSSPHVVVDQVAVPGVVAVPGLKIAAEERRRRVRQHQLTAMIAVVIVLTISAVALMVQQTYSRARLAEFMPPPPISSRMSGPIRYPRFLGRRLAHRATGRAGDDPMDEIDILGLD